MKLSSVMTLFVYAILALTGLWFGNEAFENWRGPSSAELVITLCTFMTAISATVIVLYITAMGGGHINEITGKPNSPWSIYENVGFRIQFGFNLMSTLMSYAYNAGPLQPNGEILSPWLILPILATVPIIHMMMKEAVRIPRGIGIIG